jgi:hypothetical protein
MSICLTTEELVVSLRFNGALVCIIGVKFARKIEKICCKLTINICVLKLLGELLQISFIWVIRMSQEKFNWQSTIKTNILMLKFVGLWPKNDEVYDRNLYSLYAMLSMNLLLNCHTSFQLVNIFHVYSHFEAFISSLVATSSEFVAMIKGICFMKNMKIMKDMMVLLRSAEMAPKSEHERNLIKTNLNLWRLMYYAFSSSCFMAITFWLSFPVLDGTVHQYRLPFTAWYPFDVQKSPVYYLTYLYQAISICFLGVTHVNVDMFVNAVMVFIGCQCDILCHRLIHLASDNFNNNLIECIQHHKKIIWYE